MTCLPRPTYDELSDALASDLGATIEGFAKRHGLAYDRAAFLAQSSYVESGMRELMGFGLDVWPAEAGDDDGEPINVVPFIPVQAVSATRRLTSLAAGLMIAVLGAGLFLSEPVNMDPHDMIHFAAVQTDAG